MTHNTDNKQANYDGFTLLYFLANVYVDGKHLKNIKEIDIQQCLPISSIVETASWHETDEEWGEHE